MANFKCGAVNPSYRKLLSGIKEWAKEDANVEFFGDPYSAAFKMVQNNFGSHIKYLKYRTDVTPGRVSDVMARLNELTKSIEKGTVGANWLSERFWASSHYGKQDPVIGQILKNFQRTSISYNANEVRDRNLMKVVLRSLKDESGITGMAAKLGAVAAEKSYFDLDKKVIEAKARMLNGEPGAQKEHDRLFREQKELVDRTHLKVFDEAIDIIEGVKVDGKWQYGIPKAITEKFNALKAKAEKDIAAGKKYTNNVRAYNAVLKGDRVLKLDKSDIARWVKDKNGNLLSQPMADAIIAYTTLMDGLYSTLRKGVDKRIDSMVNRMKVLGNTKTAEQFEKLKKDLRGKYMPKYEQGFFPHYTRSLNIDLMDGLMKSFDDIQSAGNTLNLKGARPKDIIKAMKMHINEHTIARQKDPEGDAYYGYSRNFFNVVTNYITDVNRFNHKSFIDSHLLDALTSVEQIFKKEGSSKDYASSITEFVLDLTKAANGDTSLDPNTRAIMRTFLSSEFVSKLGMNPRGAARNATQRFLDYVHWGPVQVYQLKRYLKDMRIQGMSADNYIESVLHDAGLLFQEAAPQVMEASFAKPSQVSRLIEYNSETNKFEANTKGKWERAADITGTVAAKSSWLHRMAENSNRKHTFKLAYAQMHRWLNNPHFKAELTAKGKDTDAQQEVALRSIAERYAMNMVILNHFDYGDYARAKMLRNPVGKFLGQFQHYSFEFYEKTADIVRESKHDIKTRNFNIFGDAQGLAKAHMMSWVYFLAPLIAGSYMGVDFGNLVEHDTAQRLQQLKVALTGDDDEIKQAFYGKGPVLATFGGPLISDIIEVGMMMELIDADDESLWTLLRGLEQTDPDNTQSNTTRSVRILNTFLGRFTERHLPLIAGGGYGWTVAAGQELGIYPTAEARKRQKRIQRIRAASIPEGVESALRNLEGR